MIERLLRIYEALLAAYGPQGWWPSSEGPFETIVGAVLTQGTAWSNAAVAVEALREAGALDPEGLRAMPTRTIEHLVRPAGFHRRKAKTLAHVAAAVSDHAGGLEALLDLDAGRLRDLLLGIHGIGEETADAILVYAAGRPAFVADAYTRRFAARHGFADAGATYRGVQAILHGALPPDASFMGEFHALIVQLCKQSCLKVPRCARCPLEWDLPEGSDGPR